MIFELDFRECAIDTNKNQYSKAEVINICIDYIMDEIFPEFEESDLFFNIPLNEVGNTEVDWENQKIRIPINPIWQKYKMH